MQAKTIRSCSVEGCGANAKSRGWCNVHYQRWYKNGDPLIVFHPEMPAVDRFWAKVDSDGPLLRPELGNCWGWTSGTFRDGYGKLKVDGKSVKAHRFSYSLVHGPLTPDVVICHRCDNPPCCRPDHLAPGTYQSNMADKMAKRRQSIGETHGRAKLTAEQVLRIRELGDSTPHTELAATFGVSPSAVRLILDGRNWKGLPS